MCHRLQRTSSSVGSVVFSVSVIDIETTSVPPSEKDFTLVDSEFGLLVDTPRTTVEEGVTSPFHRELR